MSTCMKCPKGKNCSYVCEYCSKPNEQNTDQNNSAVSNKYSDSANQLIKELLNLKLPLANLSTHELWCLLNAVQMEYDKRQSRSKIGSPKPRRASLYRKRKTTRPPKRNNTK